MIANELPRLGGAGCVRDLSMAPGLTRRRLRPRSGLSVGDGVGVGADGAYGYDEDAEEPVGPAEPIGSDGPGKGAEWFKNMGDRIQAWFWGGGEVNINIEEPVFELERSVDIFYDETITSGFRTTCSNRVDFTNVSNCRVSGVDQYCEAEALGQVLATRTNQQEYQLSMVQSMYERIRIRIDEEIVRITERQRRTRESLIDGADPNGIVTYDEVMKTISRIALKSSVKLRTICTRSASAVNTATLQDVDCQGGSITFASQTARSSAVGNCIANQSALAGEPELRDLTAYAHVLDTFVSKDEGSGYRTIVMIAGLLGLVFVGAVVGFRVVKVGEDADAKNSKRIAVSGKVGVVLVALVGLSMAFWWPGVYSRFLGVWPHGFPGSTMKTSGGEALCQSGEVQLPVHVNETAWMGNICLEPATSVSASAAGGAGADLNGVVLTSCPNTVHHYETCGLFSGCDSLEFEADRDAWIAAETACASAPVGAVQKCDPESLYLATYANDYPGCKSCFAAGLPAMVKSGASCSTATVDLTKYLMVGEEVQLDGTLQPAQCDPTDLANGICYEDAGAFEAFSPDECQTLSYQQRKREYTRDLAACIAVNNTTALPGADLSDQCPANIYDFLTKCDPATSKCTYTPVDPANLAKCENSLDGCTDPAYLLDVARDEALAYQCATSYDKWRRMNRWPLAGTIAAYVVFSGLGIGLMIHARRSRAHQDQLKSQVNAIAKSYGGRGAGLGIFSLPTWAFVTILLVLIVALLFVAPPLGWLSAAYGWGPVYSKGESNLSELARSSEGPPISSSKTTAWIVFFSLLLGLALVIAWYVFSRRSRVRIRASFSA